ncbi:MAG TPA: RHS repeat-associated core domain-containing protein [Acidobacteriota bacterium]|nr:RHS repeat-associated core domain-containing protein [Acidobacteriota bacterium]
MFLSVAFSLTAHSTGKERDETGLDFFEARYYSGVQGRFNSPDLPFADQNEDDPQSWNLYGYLRNNPLSYTDPTGMFRLAPPEQPTGPGGIFLDFYLDWLKRQQEEIVQKAPEVVKPVVDWIKAPRDPGCMAGSAAIGTAAGGFAGGTVGLLGIAGGPAVSVTVPSFSAGGGVAGGGVGFALGYAMCRTGSGQGGGGTAANESTGKGFWKGLKPFRGKIKTNGLSGKERRFFEWDHTHGDIEVYDSRGRHLGSANPDTGALTKPAVPGRRITI